MEELYCEGENEGGRKKEKEEGGEKEREREGKEKGRKGVGRRGERERWILNPRPRPPKKNQHPVQRQVPQEFPACRATLLNPDAALLHVHISSQSSELDFKIQSL